MNTLALPATSLSGSFSLATLASTAASYWIGPSTLRSPRRRRTVSVASRTASTCSPLAESPVAVGEHRDPRGDAKRRRRVRGADRDVRELLAVGLGVDRAVAVDKHAV